MTEKIILRPYQEYSVKQMMLKNVSSVFLKMGLGKTIIAAEYIRRQTSCNNFLVVCPKILIDDVWVDRLSDLKPIVIDRKSINRIVENIHTFKNKNVFITNYEFISARPQQFIKLSKYINCVILDESTMIKNIKAAVTKRMIRIFMNTKYKIVMTGTPWKKILNIFSQMKFLKNDFWQGDWWGFFYKYVNFVKEKIYVAGREVEFKKVLGPNKETLPHLISKVVNDGNAILTEDIEKKFKIYLPKEFVVPIGLKCSNELLEKYIAMKDCMVKEIDGITNSIHAGAQIIKLQQLLSETHIANKSKKFEMLIDILENEIDIDDNSVVIWCRFTETIKTLYKELKMKYNNINIAMLLGESSKDERKFAQKMITEKTSILIVQIQLGRFGLNFSNCSNAIYYELDFSLENFDQSRSRIIRMDSTSDISNNYILHYKSTVDQYIYDALQRGIANESDVIKAIYNQINK